MSLNVQKAGYEMVVHDLRHEAGSRQVELGAEWADSVGEVGRKSEVVCTSLPGPREVEAIALGPDGLIANLAPGSVWMDLSTNSPTLLRRLHAEAAKKGVHVLDTPVSGGPQGANSGKLAIWVGGDEDVFNKHRAVLDTMGDQVQYIGPIGAGSVAKLVHNCAGYAIQTALAEVFSMGIKAGVEPVALWKAVRQGAGGRRRTFDRMESYLENAYDPASFMLKLAYKDVTLATELARELNVPMRVANIAHAELMEAVGRGWGDRDSRVAMLLQNERAGIEVKANRADIDAVLAEGN
jgi:3-hydroxyisobutyrate dehydrogenase